MIPPFYRVQFPLPETGGILFMAPSYTPGDVWYEGKGKTEIYQLKDVRFRASGLNIAHTEFLFHFQNTPKLLLVVIEDIRARDLESWLKQVGVKVASDCKTYTACPRKFTNPICQTTYTPAGVVPDDEVAECPECYGTGFHKGFGAPCSKGCK